MYNTGMGPDRSRIDLKDGAQVRWWCGKFGCGDIRLREAVGAVGEAPHHVERYLKAARISRSRAEMMRRRPASHGAIGRQPFGFRETEVESR